jgi:hypothetical protein
MSVWGQTTRLPASGGAVDPNLISTSSSTANYLLQLANYGTSPSSGGAFGGSRIVPAVAGLGDLFQNIAVNGWTGALPAAAANVQSYIGGAGALGPWASQFTNKMGSWIFYRLYMEDLTASGRTWAQVDAVDKALYDSARGPGGRYNSDTFTAPGSFA